MLPHSSFSISLQELVSLKFHSFSPFLLALAFPFSASSASAGNAHTGTESPAAPLLEKTKSKEASQSFKEQLMYDLVCFLANESPARYSYRAQYINILLNEQDRHDVKLKMPELGYHNAQAIVCELVAPLLEKEFLFLFEKHNIEEMQDVNALISKHLKNKYPVKEPCQKKHVEWFNAEKLIILPAIVDIYLQRFTNYDERERKTICNLALGRMLPLMEPLPKKYADYFYNPVQKYLPAKEIECIKATHSIAVSFLTEWKKDEETTPLDFLNYCCAYFDLEEMKGEELERIIKESFFKDV